MTKTGFIEIVNDKKFNLDKTIYPSFNYSLIKKINNKYIVIHGKLKNAVIVVSNNNILFNGLTFNQAREITGLWIDIENESRKLTRKNKRLIDELINYYADVGLSINTVDKDIMFLSSFLSRNTDFHRNVSRWINYLCDCGLSLDCFEKAYLRFRSYQLKDLTNAYQAFKKIGRKIVDAPLLLKTKNIGPKVIIAYLLFSSRVGKYYAPPDKNYQKMVKKLGLIEHYVLPNKNLCLTHLNRKCYGCVLYDKCIVGQSIREFRGLSGWLQTILYIHSKTYCRKKLCQSCFLRDLCTSR
jgi:hypothetical protein